MFLSRCGARLGGSYGSSARRERDHHQNAIGQNGMETVSTALCGLNDGSRGLATRVVEPTRRMPREHVRRPSREVILRSSAAKAVSAFFANRVPWRARSMSLALIVGLLCGVVACLYELITAFVLHVVWQQGGPLFASVLPEWLPPWTYILVVSTLLGGLTGVLLHVCGEPMNNLPGVVLAAHRDGQLGYEEAPAMALISITNICAGGSLGPEAALVSIGGGLATFISLFVDLSEAETLFTTMSGMGAGLAAFFGEPVGGALFACEVLHRHGVEYYEAIIPTVIAGLACNWSFRTLADLPQEPMVRVRFRVS